MTFTSQFKNKYLMILDFIYRLLALRMTSKKAEERFIKNGGVLLEKLIRSWNGKFSPIRNFSAKELEQVTNNYDSANVFCDDGIYIWCKGCIEGRFVSIKKFHALYHYGHIHNQVVNDIVTAAQMNAHNNILKLIGCCLETHVPIPVYEFPENGTLSSHIHVSGGETTPPDQPLLWKSRLRIATEVASSVAYLHIASRRLVIHRNINSSNVFLDRHNVAKLSGFEFSIEIPDGETHVKDPLIGTRGYIAPEYYETRLLSEKIDVYNFGVLLMELLSGRSRFVDHSHIITHFKTHVISNEDNQILDPTILEEIRRVDVQPQVQAVSELALRCTGTDAEERPTMLDVARQLLQLKKTIVNH